MGPLASTLVKSSETPKLIPNPLGAWLSLVERYVRVVEVGSSNLLAPTTKAVRLS